MTIYTDSPGVLIPRPISDLPSTLGETAKAEFSSGLESGPVMSAIRYNQAMNAAQDESSPIVSKQQADEFAKSIGVTNITFPEDGARQSYLDYLQKSSLERAKSQQILNAAPSGLIATPVRFLSNLAGNAVDPANIALMMVPAAGEVKAGSMLSRFGSRFLTGAEIGAAQTAATIPFNALATEASGGDYSVGDAAGNLFMGTLTGGLMHASGGLISDLVKSKMTRGKTTSPDNIQSETRAETTWPESTPETQPASPFGADAKLSPADLNLQSGIKSSINAKEIENYAYNTAYNDIVPDWMEGQRQLTTGMRGDIGDLRIQLATNQRAIDNIDGTLKDRIEQYQTEQQMNYKAAKSKAFNDIATEKQNLSDRNDQINSLIEGNAAGEVAKGNLAATGRGNLPAELADRIDTRAQEIKRGLQQTPLASGIKTAAQVMRDQPWEVQQQVMRSAVAQMYRGEDPNIQPFIDMADPAKRGSALKSLAQPIEREPEQSSVRASQSADEQLNSIKNTPEFDQIENDMNHEFDIIDQISSDDPELQAEIKAIRDDANDETITNGIKKLAMCAMRFI